ncbi:MAG TPA: FkbM family methyltransferase, partial [Candidatus Kapabacteria bacterium]|nr:FkbM family methyltransferase [Candidatus Kapabacteria bacterium]
PQERIDFRHPAPFSLYYNARDGGVGHKFLMYREYEPNMTRVITVITKATSKVWNIGANLGYYTVLASKLASQGSVTAFEPHPNNLAMLRKNADLNALRNVTIVDAAVSDITGELSFFESPSNTGDHRIAADGSRNSIKVKALAASVAIENYGVPEILIMDVQGAEGVILRSLRQTLEVSRPSLVFEFWPEGLSQAGSSAEEVEELLHGLEYQVWRIDEYRASLLRVESGRIARGMKKGEETNLLCLPKGTKLPPSIAKGWH